MVINELDVEQRILSFPVEWLLNVNWLQAPPDLDSLALSIRQIADDFLLGRANTLGEGKTPIEEALPDNF